MPNKLVAHYTVTHNDKLPTLQHNEITNKASKTNPLAKITLLTTHLLLTVKQTQNNHHSSASTTNSTNTSAKSMLLTKTSQGNNILGGVWLSLFYVLIGLSKSEKADKLTFSSL